MSAARALSVAGWALGLALGLSPAWAAAAEAGGDKAVVDEAQQVELDALRAEVAGQVHLKAFDLLDELVFDWTQHPPFADETPVVLADVSVPLTLGTGLQALIENHFAALLLHHPGTKVVLTLCPQCTAVMVHSGAKGTIVSRGVDAPEALEQTGANLANRHAVFLDFEAEGASLVLRARITRLSKDLPIVFARTLSSATSTAALLRDEERLVSAAEARKQYVDALQDRGILIVPIRLAVRSYAKPPDDASKSSQPQISVPPFVWFEAGVEIGLSQARAWTASFTAGYTWAPELHDGWMGQARVSRLITGKARSMTHPDVYLFTGASVLSLKGTDTTLFRSDPVTADELLAAASGAKNQVTFAAWQIGLELRVKNRIGAAVYLESLPAMDGAPSLGTYLDLGIFRFQSLGVEASFCF